MPLGYAELERFYEGLVTRARAQGITCAITSGMACVAFGVAQTTKDCDVLCAPEAAERLLELIHTTRLGEQSPRYRGNLSPPLDARWLRGGWTSHFYWRTPDAEAYLDVFGLAPRGSSPWEAELHGSYASQHTVAEMKRTNREKDWPYVTALGAQMLRERDPRGWLHIFDEDLIRTFLAETQIPAGLLRRRPVLQLALANDSRLRAALHAERQFWHELDRVRIRIYARAIRPYLVAVRKAQIPEQEPLDAQHRARVECAQRHLPFYPIRDYGLDRMVAEAREALAQLVHPAAMEWLPDVREHFSNVTA